MALIGNEILEVQGITGTGLPSGETFQTTTSAIAALAAFESTPIANTAISTGSGTTLTAAAITSRLITRTGPTTPFTDTTGTAAAIIAALPGAAIGQSFVLTVSNQSATSQTIAGGTGVTISGANVIPSFSYVQYLITYTAANTVTMYGFLISYVSVDTPGTLTTVGNGTITGALFASAFLTRTGPVSAFTDTTDTAANILLNVGTYPGFSGLFTYKNATAFVATLVGGTGVTFAGGTTVPPNSAGTYIFLATSPTTVTITNYSISGNWVFNAIITNLNTVGAGTITGAGIAGGITIRGGAQLSQPFTDTTDTANNIITAFPNSATGESWEWTYRNTTNAVATIVGGSGVTVSNITVIPANSYAQYLVTNVAPSTISAVGFQQGFSSTNGLFTLTGTTAVTVSNSAITTTSQVAITLKNVGGTVGAFPAIKTITAGTGFTVAGTVGDTSTYNYSIQG